MTILEEHKKQTPFVIRRPKLKRVKADVFSGQNNFQSGVSSATRVTPEDAYLSTFRISSYRPQPAGYSTYQDPTHASTKDLKTTSLFNPIGVKSVEVNSCMQLPLVDEIRHSKLVFVTNTVPKPFA